jgi:hypothetical protein
MENRMPVSMYTTSAGRFPSGDPANDYAQAHAHLRPVAGPVSSPRRVETGGINEPLPIWLAVLLATSCHARSSSKHHVVRWSHHSGRATYTNAGSEDERIEPLGVSLPGGQTLAVSWMPGETAYTLEVFD